ncbi:LCP family protein [Paenibacillus sp. P26]|nr:LCP family protein [Paenibacillus sp. P26]
MRISGSKRNWKRVLLTATACLVIAGAGVGVYAGYIYNKANAALKSMAGGPKGSPVSDKTDLPDDLKQKPITVMLTAVDSRDGGGGSLNTDVMMLVTLNPATHAATVVSIPRDLELKPEKYGLSSHKANYYYAYYYGQDRDTAIPRTKELFSNIFQVPIDYMAVINFDGFRQMIDALGGLEINVDMDMRYTDSEDGTNINLKQGLQTLDGKNTLDFLRYRKSNEGTDDSSDIARNERQQIVLGKLIDKLTSLGGISSWGGLLDIAGNSLKTDIPEETLRDWIYSFRSLKPDTIEFLHLDGRWDSPYIVVKEEDLVQAMDALRKRAQPPGNLRQTWHPRIETTLP